MQPLVLWNVSNYFSESLRLIKIEIIQKHNAEKGLNIFVLLLNLLLWKCKFWWWQPFRVHNFFKIKIDRINQHLNKTSNNNTHDIDEIQFRLMVSYFKRMKKKNKSGDWAAFAKGIPSLVTHLFHFLSSFDVLRDGKKLTTN